MSALRKTLLHRRLPAPPATAASRISSFFRSLSSSPGGEGGGDEWGSSWSTGITKDHFDGSASAVGRPALSPSTPVSKELEAVRAMDEEDEIMRDLERDNKESTAAFPANPRRELPTPSTPASVTPSPPTPRRLFGLTAARRVRSRAPVLISASPLPETSTSASHAAAATKTSGGSPLSLRLFSSRAFSSTRPAQHPVGDAPAPSAVDCKSIMPEDKFHKLADDTIHDLLEKLEEYGDSQQMEGFDIDYGNQVLTLRLGDLGTYVVNKQTPNRQIWLSSPVSGPARFDWDAATHSWVYRRTGVNLMRLLGEEVGELCGTPLDLS